MIQSLRVLTRFANDEEEEKKQRNCHPQDMPIGLVLSQDEHFFSHI